MDIKVREVTDVEEKSSQQIEQELLDKHEQQQEATEQPAEVEEAKAAEAKADAAIKEAFGLK